jgi:hypothetical protein
MDMGVVQHGGVFDCDDRRDVGCIRLAVIG